MVHFYIGRKVDENAKMPPGAEKAIEAINNRGGVVMHPLSDKYHYIAIRDPNGETVAVVAQEGVDVADGYVADLLVNFGENLEPGDIPQVRD